MNNFIKKIDENNILGVMLIYGENGSYIPVDIFYLSSIFHVCNEYDSKNPYVIYYDDDLYFVSEDDKTIIIDAENCIKLFNKYINISNVFSLYETDFDIFDYYKNIFLKKYIPYSLDDLNAYYKNGLNTMGKNYSLIPVVIKEKKLQDECFDNEIEEKRIYADFKLVRKLKKHYDKKTRK